MLQKTKKQLKFSKVPLFYSINFQCILFYALIFYTALFCPFAEGSETENLNFIHDAVFETLSKKQLSNAKFSSFIFLAITYVPLKLMANFLPNLPKPNVLVLIRLIMGLISVGCWGFFQKQVSMQFGHEAGMLVFLSEACQWSLLSSSSRFTDNSLLRCGLYLALSHFIQNNHIMAISVSCLNLMIMKSSSFGYFSAFFPLFVNKSVFDVDSLSPFLYLSLLCCLGLVNPNISFNLQTIVNESFSSRFVLFTVALTSISGLAFKNQKSLKFSSSFVIGLMLSGFSYKEVLLPLLSLSVCFSLLDLHRLFKLSSKTSTAFLNVAVFLLASNLVVQFKNSTLSQTNGVSSFYLNDLLLQEAAHCEGPIRAHVSRTVVSAGFSKFSTVDHPKVVYEFGSQYDDHEILQKFKFRIADINDFIDPAYWSTAHVQKSVSSPTNPKLKLDTKVLIRVQPDV